MYAALTEDLRTDGRTVAAFDQADARHETIAAIEAADARRRAPG